MTVNATTSCAEGFALKGEKTGQAEPQTANIWNIH
jgi:hypothetical protein